jgi:hypothetical protein
VRSTQVFEATKDGMVTLVLKARCSAGVRVGRNGMIVDVYRQSALSRRRVAVESPSSRRRVAVR